VKLIIEPTDGVTPILAAIKRAKKSIDIAIFRFDRKDLEAALIEAVANGVRVTALIAFTNRGGEPSLRKLELRFLAAGIIVARTSGDLSRYHDKFLVVDRRVLCVLSTNFTRLDIDHSRGFGVVTTHANWVREARRLFRADCSRAKYAPKTETFVVSPANARRVLGKFLQGAKKELLIYDPQITDKEMVRVLQERQKAGVAIRVIGSMGGRIPFNVQKLAGLRLHTRTIIRDQRHAFIGSQSLRTPELESRRELGLIIQDGKAVKQLVQTFESDWDRMGSPSAKEDKDEKKVTKETPTASEQKSEKAVKVLTEDLNPIVSTMKKAVKRAVAKAGEEVLHGAGVKETMKRAVKKAVKDAVREAVKESRTK
jgi:phosphatidylserine/phosphatidylglycerophosphate/cardiolipin synthase-like enzyme